MSQEAPWYTYLVKPLAYTSYYNKPQPKLKFDLDNLHINWADMKVILSGTLLSYPDTPPKRWLQHQYNLALIDLKLECFNTIKITDDLKRASAGKAIDEARCKAYKNITEISVTQLEDGHLLVKGSGEGGAFEITCSDIRVQKIEGAHRNESYFKLYEDKGE